MNWLGFIGLVEKWISVNFVEKNEFIVFNLWFYYIFIYIYIYIINLNIILNYNIKFKYF